MGLKNDARNVRKMLSIKREAPHQMGVSLLRKDTQHYHPSASKADCI